MENETHLTKARVWSIDSKKRVCPRCAGSGVETRTAARRVGGRVFPAGSIDVVCDVCNGEGEVDPPAPQWGLLQLVDGDE